MSTRGKAESEAEIDMASACCGTSFLPFSSAISIPPMSKGATCASCYRIPTKAVGTAVHTPASEH